MVEARDADTPRADPRWLRTLIAVAITVTLGAAAVMAYGAVHHHTDRATDSRSAADVTMARQWVTLFLAANNDNVVARADEISALTMDPLQADAMNRIEPYLEMLSDDRAGLPLQITAAAVEDGGARAGRPPIPKDATVVLVTTTARSGLLGHGFALWVYVVDRAGGAKIADFGGAG